VADSDDPDRDAILARRRRLVALALSGLTSAATTVGCDEQAPPRVCLSAPVRQEQLQPCLTDTEDEPPGATVCLEMMPAEDGSGELVPVVQEYVLNTYERFDDYDVPAADAYWEKTKDYWAEIRAKWDEVAEQNGGKRAQSLRVNRGHRGDGAPPGPRLLVAQKPEQGLGSRPRQRRERGEDRGVEVLTEFVLPRREEILNRLLGPEAPERLDRRDLHVEPVVPDIAGVLPGDRILGPFAREPAQERHGLPVAEPGQRPDRRGLDLADRIARERAAQRRRVLGPGETGERGHRVHPDIRVLVEQRGDKRGRRLGRSDRAERLRGGRADRVVGIAQPGREGVGLGDGGKGFAVHREGPWLGRARHGGRVGSGFRRCRGGRRTSSGSRACTGSRPCA